MPSPTVTRAAAGLPPHKPSSPQVVTLLQARIPVELRFAMERRAADEGTSLNKLMQEALRRFLSSEPEESPAAVRSAEPEDDSSYRVTEPSTRAAMREPE